MRSLSLTLLLLFLLTSISTGVEISGVEIHLLNGLVTEVEFDRVIAIVHSMQNRGYVNASLEVVEYIVENISPDIEGKGEIERARAYFLTMDDGFKKAYNILKEYKMNNLVNENFERGYFIDTVVDLSTTAIRVRNTKDVLFIDTTSDKFAPDEYVLEKIHDLQWSVNILSLVKDLDRDRYDEGKSELIDIIDKINEISTTFYHQSSPQISIERAKDEATAGISYWPVENVSGSLVRELDRLFNITGFGLCVGRPLSILEVSKKIKEDIEFGDVVIDKTIEYESDGYLAYRAIARCRATISISVSGLFSKYGVNAHSFKPFVPKAPLIEDEDLEGSGEDIGQ